MQIGFVGAGSWGTTLAIHLAEVGHEVILWGHGHEQRERLRSDGENKAYLPGFPFPDGVTVAADLLEVARAPYVAIATPTQYIRSTLAEIPPEALRHATLISLSKGIERGTLKRISELLEETHGVEADRFVALSGPSHAEEVARHIPTLVVAASPDFNAASRVQDLFTSDWLRVYSSTDLKGVELAGALKNVIALSAGIIDGLALGDNTKAALITRGLAELTRLGVALGAEAHTFSGLSGLGDLIVTCTSRHSRNRHVGEQIGRGRRLADIVDEMKMVAEGVSTTESAWGLAARHGIETPIINEVYDVLFRDKDPRQATYRLMTRETKQEHWK